MARAAVLSIGLLQFASGSGASTYQDPRREAARALAVRAQLSGPRDPAFGTVTWSAMRNMIEAGDALSAAEERRILDVVEVSPDHRVGAMHALLLLQEGKPEAAERMLRDTLDAGPIPWEDLFARGLLADLLLQRGQAEEALALVVHRDVGLRRRLGIILPSREARALLDLELRDEAATVLDALSASIDLSEADPGTRTYLLCRAMLADDADERAAAVQRYDGLLAAYPTVKPWPRELADRAALDT